MTDIRVKKLWKGQLSAYFQVIIIKYLYRKLLSQGKLALLSMGNICCGGFKVVIANKL